MSIPEISICIPVCDKKTYSHKNILSAICKNYLSIEILFVDEGLID